MQLVVIWHVGWIRWAELIYFNNPWLGYIVSDEVKLNPRDGVVGQTAGLPISGRIVFVMALGSSLAEFPTMSFQLYLRQRWLYKMLHKN